MDRKVFLVYPCASPLFFFFVITEIDDSRLMISLESITRERLRAIALLGTTPEHPVDTKMSDARREDVRPRPWMYTSIQRHCFNKSTVLGPNVIGCVN